MEAIMARALTEKTRAEQPRSHSVSSAVHHESICIRCGGLMVNDFCMDLLNSTGELEFAAKRCVQCGEVVDSVIQHNRQLRQDSTAVRFAERVLSNNRVMEGQ